jgi:pyruvate/2-oxoglutarate dehydrogenase complex dihydrolipoamide acyltransferase (E2) component
LAAAGLPAARAAGAPPARLLLLETGGQSAPADLAPILRANLGDLAIEVTVGGQLLARLDAAAEAAEAARLGAASGAALVLWVRDSTTAGGRRLTLLLVDRLTDKTVIRSVTVPADLPASDLLRLLALKTRGLIRASLLEREVAPQSGPASAPPSGPAGLPTRPRPTVAAEPPGGAVVLEAGARVAAYPRAGRAEYGAGLATRAGRGPWRLAGSVDALVQQAARDGVTAAHRLVLPAAAVERVTRAGALEGWLGAQAGVAVTWVRASGLDVALAGDTRVRVALGATLGGAAHYRRLRLAAELGLQGLPASHGYAVHGTEIVGTGGLRVWVAIGLGASP